MLHPNFNDNLNTLLYFYSTVPQVLGAILAISGAFVVFKIDSLKRDVFGASQWLIDARNKTDDTALQTAVRNSLKRKNHYRFLYAQIANSFDEMESVVSDVIKRIGDQKGKASVLEPKYQEILNNCHALINRKKKIEKFIWKTKVTYILNGSIVMLLLAGFFIIPCLSYCVFLTYFLLVIGWIITAFSLGWIIWYLISSIGLNRKSQ